MLKNSFVNEMIDICITEISKDENKKSEYVLLGTMMSYAITIVFGIVLKQFLNE